MTPAARHAFDGPAPLFLFDGNIRGCGKTLENEIISVIHSGGDFARMSNPKNDEEARKLITALVLNGDTLVLIDNIDGKLGCAALDAALTGTVWRDRRLGKNDVVVGPLRITWYGSGNNVILHGDTTRRICCSRLESREERPEERDGFKYPNLLQYVRENRAALLADVLTILSAYCLAGKPRANLKPWGSFEGWSNLVRQAIVWIGFADPASTRLELAARADTEANVLRELIAGWDELDPDCGGFTSAKAIQILKESPSRFERLRTAVMELCNTKASELPGARQLGNKLRHLLGRVCGGRMFVDRPGPNGYKLWRVVSASEEAYRSEHESSESQLGSEENAPARSGTSIHEFHESDESHDSSTVTPYARTRAHAHVCDAPIGGTVQDSLESSDSLESEGASWLDTVPIEDVASPELLRHKRPGQCHSTRGWTFVSGELICFDCWPPTDQAAVRREDISHSTVQT